MIDQTVADAGDAMKAVAREAESKIAAFRPARLSAAMFHNVLIDYYGTPTPVVELAAVAVPEPRMAIVAPYDKTQLSAMEQAIAKAYPTWSAGNDGSVLRVIARQLSETERRDLIKQVQQVAADAKIAIRNTLRKATSDLGKAVKDGTATAAGVTDAKATLNRSSTDRQAEIDLALQRKTTELLEI